MLTLALVAVARGILPPDEPEVLRALAGLTWRAEVRLRPQRTSELRDRARSAGVSARAAEGLVREALDLDLQRRLEELILARVEPEWLDRYVQIEELPPVSSTLLLGLSRPHPLMAVVALSSVIPGLVCVAPGPGDPQTWASRRLSTRFEEERSRLRTRWVLHGPKFAGHLTATLAENGTVFATTESLGRTAFPPVAARPVFIHRARDKRWRVAVGEAGSVQDARRQLDEHAAKWPGQHLAG